MAIFSQFFVKAKANFWKSAAAEGIQQVHLKSSQSPDSLTIYFRCVMSDLRYWEKGEVECLSHGTFGADIRNSATHFLRVEMGKFSQAGLCGTNCLMAKGRFRFCTIPWTVRMTCPHRGYKNCFSAGITVGATYPGLLLLHARLAKCVVLPL